MKHFTMIVLGLAFQVSYAQQFANADMEAWTDQGSPHGESPTDWATVNNSVGFTTALLLDVTCEETSDAHGGNAACYLITVAAPIAGFPNVNGITTNGTINSTSYEVEGGVAFTARPDSLVGYYKCNPVGTDFPTIEWVLKDGAGDTIGHARFEGSNSPLTAYTRFSVPVVYSSAATPVEGVCLLSASDGFNSVVGSELWVDDLELIYVTSGMNDLYDAANVYAVSNSIRMDLSPIGEATQYEIMSAAGKVVSTGSISSNGYETVELDVSSGIYFVRLFNGKAHKTFKVYIAR